MSDSSGVKLTTENKNQAITQNSRETLSNSNHLGRIPKEEKTQQIQEYLNDFGFDHEFYYQIPT